jgi:hypothetical protein
MSEINANFVVDSVQLGITSETNNITVDTEPVNLNIFTLGFTAAGGNTGQLQFNNGGTLGGASNTNVTAGNVSFQNIGNLKIAGGSNAYFLQTDGTGNLTWAPGTSNITGNGTAAGANTQIQFTDGNGAFQAAAGFTFDNLSNTFTTPGNANVTSNVNAANVNAGNANVTGQLISTVSTGTPPLVVYSGTVVANLRAALANVANTVYDPAQPNITSVGTLTGLDVNGNIVGVNVTANTGVFTGNGSGLTNLTAGNVVGVVANANYAAYAGNVITAAQPNITSVGNLTGLTVNGNITVNSGIFTGDGAGLSNINGANVSQVANANYAIYSGTVLTNAQPNITSVGNLSSLIVTGNANSNIVNANYVYGDCSNITNVRALTHGTSNVRIPTANGNVTIGVGGTDNITIFTNSTVIVPDLNLNNIAVSLGANSSKGTRTVAIGENALATNPGFAGVGIGNNAGNTNQGNYAIAIGSRAQASNANAYAIAIGADAGLGFAGAGQGANAIAIGYNAGFNNQGINAVALGSEAGGINQGSDSIAIGKLAGSNSQGINSIAIGKSAGNTFQANNSIVLNATGANLTTNTANTLFVKPIRFSFGPSFLYYDSTTGEIVYYPVTEVFVGNVSSNANITTNNFICNNFANVSGNLRSNNLVVTNFANVTGNINSGNANVGNLLIANYVKINPVAVANLPTAANAGSGTKAIVTDGNTTTFYAVIGNGGTNTVPVFSDGSNWRVG